jgi:hypothetical protein
MHCLAQEPSIVPATANGLHHQWLADLQLRQRVPEREAWRGCMGLAALIDDPDSFIHCGDHRLMPNAALRWLALRDVPASPEGRFPRGARLASVATARIRYGMPQIDFAQDSLNRWNFQLMPFDRCFQRAAASDNCLVNPMGRIEALNSRTHVREFEVLNRLSSAMTRFAFFALDHRGRPVRPAWWTRRPGGLPQEMQPPTSWFPTAYLAYDPEERKRLYDIATCARPRGTMIECCKCGRYLDTHSVTGGLPMEGDCCIATCRACGVRHKWDLARIVPARVAGQHLIAFKDRFCRAVVEGLPLASVGPSVYCGSVPFKAERDCPKLPDAKSRALELVVHRFRNELTGEREFVYLPPTARLRVRVGEVLQQGRIWCAVLEERPGARWCEQDRLTRWNSLDAVLGGAEYVGLLQRVWFDHQALMCKELGSGQMLVPADLVSLGARNLHPLDLFWDLLRGTEFEPEKSAAVFPPLRLHQWNNIRFNLPGDVAMNASIDAFANTSRMAATRGIPRSTSPTRSSALKEVQVG